MTILRFSDGVDIDTSGPYRLHAERDGLYVVGRGFLCAVDNEVQGRLLIEQLVVGYARRPDYRGFTRKICALAFDEGGSTIEYDDFIAAGLTYRVVREEPFDATNPKHREFAEEWGEVDVIYFENTEEE